MKISIFCLLPLGIAAAANLRRLHGGGVAVGLAADSDDGRHGSQRNEQFKLQLINFKGVQYTAPVTLNNQELMAVYDTGSFEIMAISRQCKVCKLPATLNTYDNSTSSSFVAGDRPIENHHFAGGTVVARQDFETVHVGTANSIFEVKKMAFWQVVDTDMLVWRNKKATFTAIVGLGHRGGVPDTPSDGVKPMDSLIERTGTQRFALCLVRGPANPGYLVFNPAHDFSPANFASMFRRISVIGKHHWAVAMNSVSVIKDNTKSQRCIGDHKCVAIIDSGTSLIGVPPSAVSMVYDVIQQVEYDCSNLDQLPDLVFELDGQKFAMPGAAYTVQMGSVDGKPERCLPAFTDFAMNSDNGEVWILGMPFLRHFYTVFDREEPSIYVADQGDDCEPIPARKSSGADGAFFNATSFNTTGLHSRHTQATMADVSEARLPSWAYGQKYMTV